jgi:Ca2+:H+ antiporter
MLGSILSNILLVLGCCFFLGGIHNTRTGTARGIEQSFNSTAASTMSSLMAVASASLIIPAALHAVLPGPKSDTDAAMLILSHGTSIILLILYVLYLGFQLRTHADLFNAEALAEQSVPSSETGLAPEEPQLGPVAASAVLVLTTLAVAVCAEYLVGSIDALVATVHVSKTFVGLVLLPIVGNAAEHVTAIVVALKDKMDLAMGVAIGSSMQIALLVTPLLVILGWIIDEPMTLHFETFETVVFFLSVLVVAYVIQDGKSNYLEGAMVGFSLPSSHFLALPSPWFPRRDKHAANYKKLLGLYIIIALAFLVYPDSAPSTAPGDLKLAVRGLVGGWYPLA